MTQDPKDNPQYRRTALYGFAEHIWKPERSRWVLRPRWKPILYAASGVSLAAYMTCAGVYYAINRWYRECEDTSFREMTLFVFPNPLPGTGWQWAPDFISTRVDAARDSQRRKLATVLFMKAKSAMETQDWRNFFHNIFAASKLDPRNIEARLLSAQAFFALRRDDDAIDAIEEPIPLLLDKPDYALEYIRACFAKEKETRLIGMAKYVLAQPKASPAVHEIFAKGLATAHFVRGEYELCARVIATEKLERTAEGFMLTVRMLGETGKKGEAIAMLEPVALATTSDASFLAALIDLKKSVGDIEGAKSSASIYLIRAREQHQARIKVIELLESPEDLPRREEAIAAYRRDFAGQEMPTLLLCEYAADRGLVSLCAELMREAQEKKFAEAPRFELLHIESHLKTNRFEETVALVDAIYLDNPRWLPKYRQIFDCLRMVAQMSMNRGDMSEIGFRNLRDRSESLPMPLMTTVAKKLIQVGRAEDAIRVIDLAYERNARSQAALMNVVEIHIAASGSPHTPAHLRRLISTRRPSSDLLHLARTTMAGDAFLFEPDRDKLLADIETLLAGNPILPEVPASVPKTIDPS